MQDINSYLAGINAYITQAYNNRTFPGEYDLTGHINPITNAGSIAPFTATDLIAIAAVVGALFGTGGGGEVQSALVKEAADAQYGVTKGDQVWRSFQEENDPEADLTLHDGQSFPYSASPANPQGVAMPDAGSVTPQQEVFDPTGSATSNTAPRPARESASHARSPRPRYRRPRRCRATRTARINLNPAKGIFDNGVLPGSLLSAKHGMSNALVVSGQYTDDGHPIAVFGPQTGYFAPQLLMLEELQGPGISSRGAAFAGLSFYVELGRGEDYSWSATSAGQDITDTFAIQLCNPDGSPATEASNSYVYNGQCTAMQRPRTGRLVEPDHRGQHSGRFVQTDRLSDKLRPGPIESHDQRPTRRVHQSTLDLHARGRVDHRLPDVQRPGANGHRATVRAGRVEHQLHVQLVLRELDGHRVLQLRLEPAAPVERRPEPAHPGRVAVRVDELESVGEHRELHRVRGASQLHRPELLHLLEQQAGAELHRRRLRP